MKIPFSIVQRRRVHLLTVLATLVGVAAGYGAATIHQRPFDAAAAAEPRIPAVPAPGSAVTPAQLPSATTQPIPVVTPRTESVSNYVEVTGNAASVNDVKLIARVEGYLDQIHYEDGQFVKKDDLLFTIQQDQYKDQLQQAEAQLLTAQAALTMRRPKSSGTRSWSSRTRQPRSRSITGLSSGRAPRRHCSTRRLKLRWPS